MNESFHVFLSHNSKDKPAVRQLAQALQARGLKVWLDEEQLVPGQPWQQALEEIIQTTRTVAVLVGKDGLGPWEIPEMRACLYGFVARYLPVIPVLLPDAPAKPELPLFLRAFTWVDLRGGLTDEGLDRLEWGITGVKDHGHRFGHSDQQVSDRGMWNQQRLNRKIDSLNRQWELLNEKLSSLNRQSILENRVEEKLRLKNLIDDMKTQRDQVEEQLKNMERQLAKVGSDAKEGASRDDDQGRIKPEEAELPKKMQVSKPAGSPPSKLSMNRQIELDAFKKIATGNDTQTRLILVTGEGGIGKSYLLSLYKQVADENNLNVLTFSLGVPPISVENCIDQIVVRFGVEHFHSYDKFLINHPHKPLPPAEEEVWQRILTSLFFKDLDDYINALPLVIFFDQYEKADQLLKNWLTRIFLPYILVRYPIIVVIAGRESIELPSSAIGYRRFLLEGVTEDWYHRYVADCKINIDSELINEFHKLLRGRPKEFVEYVKVLSQGVM